MNFVFPVYIAFVTAWMSPFTFIAHNRRIIAPDEVTCNAAVNQYSGHRFFGGRYFGVCRKIDSLEQLKRRCGGFESANWQANESCEPLPKDFKMPTAEPMMKEQQEH